jgi:hypothetical protein
MRNVHRVAYEAAYGPIPDGLHVLRGQGCSQRCVNVKHMRLGNRLENQQRSRSERLAKHIDTTRHPNGCHIWTASTFHDGYPKMRDIPPKTGKSTMRGAHIIMRRPMAVVCRKGCMYYMVADVIGGACGLTICGSATA